VNTTPTFPQTNDPLGEILHQLRLDNSLYYRSVLSGDWSLVMPVLPGKMMFHIITSGQYWLQIETQDPILLPQETLVFIPHGHGHVTPNYLPHRYLKQAFRASANVTKFLKLRA
jgi:hypothetical protein